MPLQPGARLGPYEIIAPVGAGGMGEVYRARDTRLDRTVAIKVLPQQLAADPQFRERFDREARTISQLTHPHVCTLYDVGDHEGTAFLVMEYLEGETLAARIERGALKLDEALRLAMEIVSALDAAHRAGVVHRDLKPANVMLTKSSAGSASSPQAKLLDFGLAKAGASTVAGGLTMLPTTPAALTAQGTILGTFQYMAPEQIEGQEADARSDIWAFGCVLYEMLTGKRAFEAKTQATLIAAIVDRQPQPVSAVQPLTPPALDRVVAACLAKDPADRLQTAHDLLLQLRWIAEGGSAVGVPVPVAPVRRSHQRLAWTVAAVLGAGFLAASVVAVMHLRETPAPADPAQFTVAAPDRTTLAGRQLALSPDGRQLAVLVMSQGIRQIYVRPIGSLVGRLLQGSEEAVYPFWSADSRWLGFFAGGKLKKIQVSGGPAIVLCDAPNGRGGAWNHDNVILFAPTPGTPLMRVSAAGGEPAPVTTLETNENTHRWPYFLPDGEHFVFGAGNSGNAGARGTLKLSSLASRDVTTLFEVEGLGGYSAGHLLHVRGRTLLAQPFDLRSLRTTGDPFPVTDNLAIDGAAFAAVSGTLNGVIAYMRGTGTPVTALTWQDRGGKLLGTVLDPGVYNNLSLSPDERRLAVAIDTGSPPNRDVWIVDLARGVPTRLTFDPGSDGGGAWSSEGTRIALTSNRGGPFAIFTLSSTLPGTEKQLFDSKTSTYAPSWSADGRHLAFSNLSSSATGWDLWILPMDGDRKPYPFVQTPAQEDNAEFSPDGHWIAYSSTESSREEVYVRPFPGPGGQYQVSRAGGTQPQWRGDGRELFFLGLDAVLMATTVGGTQQSFEAGIPEALFETSVALAANQNRRQYAAAKDGKRFLVNLPYRGAAPQPVTVVLNWPAAIKP